MARGIGRLILAVAAVLLVATPALADGEIKSDARAHGEVKDLTLREKAPKEGYLNDQKAYDALVKSWGVKDAPKVDFRKQLVLVSTTTGRLLPIEGPLRLKDGDLKVGAIARDWTPTTGFRYLLRAVPKEGVKKVNGKEIK